MIGKILKWIGIGFIALVVGLSILMTIQNQQMPETLGVNNGKLAPMPDSPNAVSSQTDVVEKQVAAFDFAGNITTTHALVLATLAKMSENEVITNSPNYVHSVFVTPTMRYRDDVEIYLDVDTAKVHYRSGSRVGYGDGGLNRKRYEEFSRLYREALNQ